MSALAPLRDMSENEPCEVCGSRPTFSYHPHCVDCIVSEAYPHIGYSYEDDEVAEAREVIESRDAGPR